MLLIVIILWAVAGASLAVFILLSGKAFMERRKEAISSELAQLKRSARPPVNEDNYFYVQGILTSLAFLFLLFATGSIIASLLLSVATLLIPPLYVRRWKKKRLEKLEEQMSEVLRAIAGAMRAGRSLPLAIESVSKTFSEPSKSEYTLMALQMKLGASPEEAIREAYERTGSEDLLIFASAVESARRAGGNLSEVMDKLAEAVTKRIHVKMRVRTLSAQGRAQGYVLGALPFLMFLILYFLDRDMLFGTFRSILGIILMAFAGLLWALGIFVMRKIMEVEI